ncbi:hypothetical protein ACHAXT_002175 [Thalassiosira profunda]
MVLPPPLSPDALAALLDRADAAAASAREELDRARPLAEAAGLTVHGSVLDPAYAGAGPALASGDASAAESTAAAAALPSADLKKEAALALQARQDHNPLRGSLSAFPLVLSTSAGHSNTDHIVQTNPDGTVHRLSEYKRQLKRRHRQTQIEERGTDRWDLPRIPGGRRRRIKRDTDAAAAPPEPPKLGYVIYLSQMTTKLRHDNPDRHHNQIMAVRTISAKWNALPDPEKEHYVSLARDARGEYEDRLREYRATGHWSPYAAIARLDNNKNGAVVRTDAERHAGGNGPWVRIPLERKNELEREIEGYEQVIFPPRPKGAEEDHERKMKESQERRRKKIRKEGLKHC